MKKIRRKCATVAPYLAESKHTPMPGKAQPCMVGATLAVALMSFLLATTTLDF